MSFDPPVEVATLPGPVQRMIGPTAPAPLRTLAARGAAPGLRPEQIVTVVALLARADLPHVDEASRATAEATLRNLPAPVLGGAVASPDLPAGILDLVAALYIGNMQVVERVVVHPAVAIGTIVHLAKEGNDAVTELVATNEERLLEHTAIIDALYMNKRTRMSTADRILDLAVRNGKQLALPAFREAAEAIKNETIVPPSGAQPNAADILFAEAQRVAEALEAQGLGTDHVKDDEERDEVMVDEKLKPLDQRIRDMTVSQKIRTAMLGSSAARALLIRDKNRLVAAAVVRSPLVQDNEIAIFSASRAIGEEILRIIASNGEFTRSHVIKFNLVANPKTPISSALRLLPHLRSDELKKLTKSKNVSAQINKLARQELDKKKPGSQ